MPAKRRFTQKEAKQIKSLLREKARASSNEQKSIRARLRRMGFYITNFDQSYSGFTAGDFESLVKRGMIIIIDG